MRNLWTSSILQTPLLQVRKILSEAFYLNLLLTKIVQDTTHDREEGPLSPSRTTGTLTCEQSSSSAFRKFLGILKSSLGRNSQFYGLSHDERNKLGSIEYKALRFLLYLIPAYLVLLQLIGTFILALDIIFKRPHVALSNAVNPL